jgi:hypothetical protein
MKSLEVHEGDSMQAFRAGVFTLASLLLSSVFALPAAADVRPIAPAQTLARPATPTFTRFGDDVAIDGSHIIVLARYAGGQQALLYRRNNSNGQWLFRRGLVARTGAFAHPEVAMKNGIAAIQFGNEISLFEYSGDDYVSATSVAPIRHQGGLAISSNRLLIGGNNCDYDAVIYQKNAAGSWDITGRIDDNQGPCFSASERYDVELNYDYALLHAPYASEARAWRRNGSAIEWIASGTLATSAEEPITNDAWALQGATAVSANGVIWRRNGSSSWVRHGVATSIDRDDGGPATFGVVYRDGVLITSEATSWRPFPRVYIESSPGQFEHVATLATHDGMGSEAVDVSGRRVVVAATDYDSTRSEVRVSTLPMQLRAPPTIVNDFEERDLSDFTFSGGQFVLATRGSDDVLAQSSASGLAVGLLNESDWADDQRVEALVTPTWSGAGSWVGLVARYADADNYYYVAMRETGYSIHKRVNGVDTRLFEGPYYNTRTPTFRAQMIVIRNTISVHFGFQQGTTITDRSLVRGRAGVATWLARSDFNNVLVSPTDQYYPLFSRIYGRDGYDAESGLQELSGTWTNRYVCEDEDHCRYSGLSQTDTSGNAFAVNSTALTSQAIGAIVRLDAHAPSQQGAWFGLLARFVDERNHYYVTLRSSGQVQIRKIVNGVITVLASANLVTAPGHPRRVELEVIEDQMHLYVDEQLVLTAHDRDIPRGRYGMATYRTAATWESFWVDQNKWPR